MKSNEIRSSFLDYFKSKGHAIVAFDAIALADGARVVAEIGHSAIWRPRQVAKAAGAQAEEHRPA